jgi:hypothetical protein
MDLERVTFNHTPLAVRCVPLEDRRGRDVGVAIAKLTLAFSARGVVKLAEEPRGVRLADVPVSNDRWSSLRYPSDLVDDKPGTDVLLLGTAHPPAGKRVTSADVSVRVEAGRRTIGKQVRAHGPRVYYQGALGVVPGPAAELAPVPLLYEEAYGGVDDADPDRPRVEWRNPAGRGAAIDRFTLIGRPAPALEDPRDPLSPAAFGPIAAHWAPRRDWMGTCDEAWRRERAPIRPLDFDPRHHAAAHPDLWSEEPLLGDEPIEILGASPEGALRFRLPRFAPRFDALVDGRLIDLATHLDTLLIDADLGRVELTWRASFVLPRKPESVQAVRVRGSGMLPERGDPDRRSLPIAREVP